MLSVIDCLLNRKTRKDSKEYRCMSDFSTNPLKVTRVFQLDAITFLVETVFPFCFILYDCYRVAKVLHSFIYSKSGSAILRQKHTLK